MSEPAEVENDAAPKAPVPAPMNRAQRRQHAGKSGSNVVRVPRPAFTPAEDVEEFEVPQNDGALRFSSKIDDVDNPFSEMEPVFWIDETVYEAPVQVPASWGLHYLRIKVLSGVDMAVIYALEQTVGVPALQELMNLPGLTPEELDTIVQRITQKFVDATRVPKGE